MTESPSPFSNIALSLSGGGFRAAAYSLGVMSYLHELGILKDVKSISSVSGGSFTALKYFQMMADDKNFSFDAFYKEMYKSLEDNDMHIHAINNLNSNKIWDNEMYSHKRRNLINSFALEYNDFLKGKTLGDLMVHKKRLPELICNSTDMTHANQFRFKISNGNRGKFGNGHIKKVDENHIKQIKLGDMLAASSCFPGGFEPISFPNDFFSKSNRPTMKEIGLMDGGIINNQGLNQYIVRKNQPDLIIAADVESFNLKDSFKFVDQTNFIEGFRLITSGWILLVGIILIVTWYSSSFIILASITGYLLSLLILIQVGIFFAFKKGKKVSGMPAFIRFSSSRYGNYLVDRANSLFQLALNVFMKNNRRMGYSMAYKSKEGQDYDKVAMVAIYDLQNHNRIVKETANDELEEKAQESKWNKMVKLFLELEPNDTLTEIAKKASEFDTTLWFDEDEKLKKQEEKMINKLIATGRMTTCFVLIKYILSHEINKKIKRKDVPFYNVMTKDWVLFKSNPYHGMNMNAKKNIIKNDGI